MPTPRPQCPVQSARSVADPHPEVRGLLTGGQAGCREGRNSWAARRSKTPAGRVHGLAGVRLQQTRLPRRGSEVIDPDSLPCQDHREFTHARHAQSLLSAPGPAGGGTPRMFVLPTCSARAAVTRDGVGGQSRAQDAARLVPKTTRATSALPVPPTNAGPPGTAWRVGERGTAWSDVRVVGTRCPLAHCHRRGVCSDCRFRASVYADC